MTSLRCASLVFDRVHDIVPHSTADGVDYDDAGVDDDDAAGGDDDDDADGVVGGHAE